MMCGIMRLCTKCLRQFWKDLKKNQGDRSLGLFSQSGKRATVPVPLAHPWHINLLHLHHREIILFTIRKVKHPAPWQLDDFPNGDVLIG